MDIWRRNNRQVSYVSGYVYSAINNNNLESKKTEEVDKKNSTFSIIH